MISIIVAIGRNNLIGNDNKLPWYYPEDLKYFKETTLGRTLLMGDNTFYSIVDRIGKPLPKRKSIVCTLDKNFAYPGIEVVYDLISFLKEEHNEEIFIIGGKQIYTLALPYANKLYITHIDKYYEGNVFFPKIDYSKYSKKTITKSENGELTFCVYEKVK